MRGQARFWYTICIYIYIFFCLRSWWSTGGPFTTTYSSYSYQCPALANAWDGQKRAEKSANDDVQVVVVVVKADDIVVVVDDDDDDDEVKASGWDWPVLICACADSGRRSEGPCHRWQTSPFCLSPETLLHTHRHTDRHTADNHTAIKPIAQPTAQQQQQTKHGFDIWKKKRERWTQYFFLDPIFFFSSCVHLIIFFFFLFALLLTSSKLLQSRGLLIDPQSLPPGHTHTQNGGERERDFALEKNQLVNEEDDRRGGRRGGKRGGASSTIQRISWRKMFFFFLRETAARKKKKKKGIKQTGICCCCCCIQFSRYKPEFDFLLFRRRGR